MDNVAYHSRFKLEGFELRKIESDVKALQLLSHISAEKLIQVRRVSDRAEAKMLEAERL